MNEEQYRRTIGAIKCDAIERVKIDLAEMVYQHDGYDDVLETIMNAQGDIDALADVYIFAQQHQAALDAQEEAEAESQMQRMHHLTDDISLVNAQLDADAGIKFEATEPPDDAEADGTND